MNHLLKIAHDLRQDARRLLLRAAAIEASVKAAKKPKGKLLYEVKR